VTVDPSCCQSSYFGLRHWNVPKRGPRNWRTATT